jgi:hypothetical protein
MEKFLLIVIVVMAAWLAAAVFGIVPGPWEYL